MADREKPLAFSLAKQTVTVHQHLDATVSIRFGPHVVGRYDAEGHPLAMKGKRGGKDGSMEAGENQKPKRQGSGLTATITLNGKADTSRVNKSGHLDKLTTGLHRAH